MVSCLLFAAHESSVQSSPSLRWPVAVRILAACRALPFAAKIQGCGMHMGLSNRENNPAVRRVGPVRPIAIRRMAAEPGRARRPAGSGRRRPPADPPQPPRTIATWVISFDPLRQINAAGGLQHCFRAISGPKTPELTHFWATFDHHAISCAT